jgi:hypothetical protein
MWRLGTQAPTPAGLSRITITLSKGCRVEHGMRDGTTPCATERCLETTEYLDRLNHRCRKDLTTDSELADAREQAQQSDDSRQSIARRWRKRRDSNTSNGLPPLLVFKTSALNRSATLPTLRLAISYSLPN